MTDASKRLVLARDLDEPFESRRQHARNVRRGSEIRVSHGAYVDAATWEALDPRSRYLLHVRAVAETRHHRPVLSHRSAAAVHGLPVLGEWPRSVHITAGVAAGGRSSGDIIRHSARLADDDVVEVDGLLVTSVARTVLDLATDEPLLESVPALDRALHIDRRGVPAPLITTEAIWASYARRMPFRGHVRARTAIEFAVSDADSPLESVSRVNMRAIGCPRPELQARFDDYRGLIGFSEFYWREHRTVGEADGRSKYTDPRYRRGRTLEEVLLDEKTRADRIRALGIAVSRWGWQIGVSPVLLARHLAAAGLPLGLRW
jgi:hypothetical protein